MSPSVSVVIVNCNSGGHLALCLGALARDMQVSGWDVVVVDNASTDGSENVATMGPGPVRLVRNTENAGFAAAVNRGVSTSVGDLVLVLNPDCQLRPEAMRRLTATLDRQARCAVVGPRVLSRDGSVQGSARGDPTMVTGLFGRSTLFTRLIPRSPVAQRNVKREGFGSGHPDGAEVDWVSGACMLARRTALAEIGGFDQRYFLYWEDADLCRRLRDTGWTIRYVPAAEAVHVVGGSADSAGPLAVRAFHRSAFIYYTTHVARGHWNPKRWLAWTLLEARCRWKLLSTSPWSRRAR